LVEKGWAPSMGARPLRRAIQRYIEDPLADFVLREQLTPGATVVIDPAPEGEENEVRLTIVKPKRQKTPVAVGAGGGGAGAPDGEGDGDGDGVPELLDGVPVSEPEPEPDPPADQ